MNTITHTNINTHIYMQTYIYVGICTRVNKHVYITGFTCICKYA